MHAALQQNAFSPVILSAAKNLSSSLSDEPGITPRAIHLLLIFLSSARVRDFRPGARAQDTARAKELGRNH